MHGVADLRRPVFAASQLFQKLFGKRYKLFQNFVTWIYMPNRCNAY
jgi:hypothetical protein